MSIHADAGYFVQVGSCSCVVCIHADSCYFVLGFMQLPGVFTLGCALTLASEAKFEIEAKILFRLEVKKKPDFT